jgi:hypothetical protein
MHKATYIDVPYLCHMDAFMFFIQNIQFFMYSLRFQIIVVVDFLNYDHSSYSKKYHRFYYDLFY